MKDSMMRIENVLRPGKTYTVNGEKYAAMQKAVLAVTPLEPPGASVRELQAAVLGHLPEALFPGGSTAGWWFKAVQLDLEAKSVLVRSTGTPLRLRKTVEANSRLHGEPG